MLVMISGQGDKYYCHANFLGTVTHVTNSTGSLVEEYRYDAYGKATIYDGQGREIAESAIGNPYMFTGRRYDRETGLYYYRARYYDPDTGRFIQRDNAGYIDGVNLYSYCRNNPINRTDRFGWQSEREPIYTGEDLARQLRGRKPWKMGRTVSDYMQGGAPSARWIARNPKLYEIWHWVVRQAAANAGEIKAFLEMGLADMTSAAFREWTRGHAKGTQTTMPADISDEEEARLREEIMPGWKLGESYKTAYWRNYRAGVWELTKPAIYYWGTFIALWATIGGGELIGGGTIYQKLGVEFVWQVNQSGVAEPTHIGIDFLGRNLIHYGRHVLHGRHIGLLWKGGRAAWIHIGLTKIFIKGTGEFKIPWWIIEQIVKLFGG